MHYRDLLPDRLGGAIIASHIRIAEAGPVADMVHFHTVGFQLIFCHRGWVRLVYEDQGPPFVLGAGDCVIQPPEIRHRVLEASAGVEVIEIGVPAEHLTSVDHEMELPTPHFRPEREFQGTKFVLHREAEATWDPWRIPGFEMRETGIGAATGGVAGVQVARRVPGEAIPATRHDTDILFGFLRAGSSDAWRRRDTRTTRSPRGTLSCCPRTWRWRSGSRRTIWRFWRSRYRRAFAYGDRLSFKSPFRQSVSATQ